MVTVEDFSRLVSGVYDAVVSPDHWVDAIRDIQHSLGGLGATLLVGDGDNRTVPAATTLPEEAGASYAEYYHRLDSEVQCMLGGPVGVVRGSTELLAGPRNVEFDTDWLRPLDLEDGLFVRLTADPQPICLVIGFGRPSQDPPQSERVEILTGLVSHLQQALRTQARLGQVAGRAEHLAEALALHRHAIIVIGAELAALEMNPAAERMLASQDGLLFADGRITAKRDSTSCALQRAAHIALAGDSDEVRSGRTLLCQRPSGKRPYIVHVVPLQSDPTAVIVVIDPDRDPLPPVPLLRRMYRLTQTEAEIASRIARGADVRHIAEELSVSIPTVRTHLQHLYDKTGTHRQAELIRLLLAFAP